MRTRILHWIKSRSEFECHKEVEPKHLETNKDILSKPINEKEMVCNQHEPQRIYGAGVSFLKDSI